MQAVVLACAAQAVYIAAYVLFKTAAGRMGPVSGRHPAEAAARFLGSPRWLAGLLVLAAASGSRPRPSPPFRSPRRCPPTGSGSSCCWPSG